MAETLGWGILGTGGIATSFATDLNAVGLTIAAVGSRTVESATAFAQLHGIPAAHGSYAELVADPTVDIIYVSTPHPFHAEHAKLALEAGKHVLVEKPFTINAAEAREVVALAEAKGLTVLEAMWTRWLPHMVRLREVLASGAIGEVRTVIADHNQQLPADPSHRINAPELGGGALLDLGIYPVSFAWDILGVPNSVSAIATKTATGVDRQTAILLGYESGAQAVLHTALDTPGPNTASVIGTEGWVAIERTFYTPTSFTVFDSAGAVVDRFEQEVESRGMQFQAFEAERLVREGHSNSDILPPAESVAIMETLDEVRKQIALRYPSE